MTRPPLVWIGILLAVVASACTSGALGSASPQSPAVTTIPSPARTSVASTGYINPTSGSALVYQVAGMDKAQVTRAIVYSSDPADPLRMDIYRPAETAAKPLPAILIGGPPAYNAGKDSGQKVGWSQLIAANGLVAVAFDIRSDNYLTTPGDPSTDVAAAIAYVRKHGAELGIDADRLGTLGFSFGTAPWHLWATMRKPQPFLKCNTVFYGPLDLHNAGVSMDAKLADEFSAMTFLRLNGSNIPPMFVAKGGLDSALLNASIDAFVAEADRVGAHVRLEVHEQGPHGFDLRSDDDRSREIIKNALAFMQGCTA